MKFIEIIMFGIKLFAPKCMVRESIYRKYNHRLYIFRDYKNGLKEIWAVPSKNPSVIYEGRKRDKDIFLGSIMDKYWSKPKDFYDQDYGVQRMAEEMYRKLQLPEFDDREIGVYSLKSMKKKMKEKKIYTVEDFRDFGKAGQAKVRAKYGVGSVTLRWKKAKLSTGKDLDKK